jgi:hypothetical protein
MRGPARSIRPGVHRVRTQHTPGPGSPPTPRRPPPPPPRPAPPPPPPAAPPPPAFARRPGPVCHEEHPARGAPGPHLRVMGARARSRVRAAAGAQVSCAGRCRSTGLVCGPLPEHRSRVRAAAGAQVTCAGRCRSTGHVCGPLPEHRSRVRAAAGAQVTCAGRCRSTGVHGKPRARSGPPET